MHPARLVSLLLAVAGGVVQAADNPHLCRVPGGELLGYGDRLCRTKIPYRYTFAEPFTADGIAVVTIETNFGPLTGVVDRNGKEVLPPVYRHVVLGPAGQILATKENPACPFHPAPTTDMLFDATGRALLSTPFARLGFFREGLASAQPVPPGEQACTHPHELRMYGRAPKVGFVDRAGQFAIPPQFDEANDFNKIGLTAVQVGRQWGFVDKLGKIAIAPQYDRVAAQFDDRLFDRHDQGFGDEGLARVETRDGVQLIDSAGRSIGPGAWWRIGEFDASGIAPVSRAVGPHTFRNGLMDTHGKVVAEPVYAGLQKFANGYAAAMTDKHWGFIDAHGAVVVPMRYTWVGSFGKHGLAKVLLHPGRDPGAADVGSLGYGFVDARGQVVLDKDDYDEADDFQDDMDDPVARVTRNGKTAYVDRHGKVALGWFEAGSRFGRDGLAAVKVDGKFGYVDRTGRMVIAPAWDRALRFDNDAFALVKLGARWGMVDHAGKVVVPIEFDRLAGFAGDSITLGRRGGHDVSVDRGGHVAELPPLGPMRGVPVDDL